MADPDKNLSVQFQGGLHLKADMLLKDGETFEAAGYTFQMPTPQDIQKVPVVIM